MFTVCETEEMGGKCKFVHLIITASDFMIYWRRKQVN